MTVPNKHYDLYEKYYRATVGKFFTKDQCRRLLSLLAASFGMEFSATEYSAVLGAIDTIEAHDITGFIESKNFHLLCEILEEDPEVICAATALSAVFEDLTARHAPHYTGLVERTIALRTAMPRTNEVRRELAYLEYALADLADAKEEFAALCERGDFDSVAHLAYLAMEEGDHEAAFYYLLLLRRIYERELELAPEGWIENRLAFAEGQLAPRRAAELRERVSHLPPFLTGDGNRGGIGFAPSSTRRFSYEP